ncbi:uncharacterized protein [Littorina saxatilis]|uniref:uncharacterized protein n=1 Tax=Littorina saxatilis TaxID=31220 RepID=UPI0038B63B68
MEVNIANFRLASIFIGCIPFQYHVAVSCDFENGQCGWKDGENTTLHWTEKSCCGGDHYMALDMDSAQVNDTGLLFSPMLHGSVNQTCRLRFNRFIKNDKRACQLAVFLVTETNWTLLWRTVDVTGEGLFGASWHSETSPGLQRPCTEPSFQIVFEGRKKKNTSCGGTVDVDDIVFEFSQPDISTTLPTPTTTSVPATELSTGNTHVDINTQASENSTAPDHSQTNNPTEAYSAEDSDSGVSTAVITAVVAIILAVVIIICLILIVFLRRRAQKQGKTDHWTLHLFRTQKTPSPRPTRASAVYTNSCYVSCDDQVQANPGSNNSSGIHGGGHTGSVHHYSTVDDTGYELSSPFSPNTNEQGRGSCSNNQDSYNVLSLKDPQVTPPPGPLPEDFYNHLNEDGETPEPRSNPSASSRHHGQPGIQDDSKPSHLQDENSESPAKPIDHCSVSSKTGTTSNVAGAAATNYEVVGDDGAGNMMVSSL